MSSQQLIPPSDLDQEHLREERRAARMLRRRERRRARIIYWFSIGSAVLLLGIMGFAYLQMQAMLAFNAAHPPINGVTCDTMEQGGYHIHAHLTIYVNGQHVTVPKGIGIAPDGSCFYWLHTHTSDGIIHIEAPQKQHNEALDDFLTIWHDGFAGLGFPTALNQQTGWKIYVNGKPFSGVVLEYGSPNPLPDSFYIFPPNVPQ